MLETRAQRRRNIPVYDALLQGIRLTLHHPLLISQLLCLHRVVATLPLYHNDNSSATRHFLLHRKINQRRSTPSSRLKPLRRAVLPRRVSLLLPHLGQGFHHAQLEGEGALPIHHHHDAEGAYNMMAQNEALGIGEQWT